MAPHEENAAGRSNFVVEALGEGMHECLNVGLRLVYPFSGPTTLEARVPAPACTLSTIVDYDKLTFLLKENQ